MYEIHGNVWEWCEDIYQDNLGDAAVIDPVGAANGTPNRVLRGRSWYDSGRIVRSASRYYDYGFRLALDHIELRRVAEQDQISEDVFSNTNIHLALSKALLEVEPTQQRSTKKRRKKGKSDKYSPTFP